MRRRIYLVMLCTPFAGTQDRVMVTRAISVVFVFAVLLGVQIGCASDEYGGLLAPNEPPSVWVAGAPPEGSVSAYNVHLFWGGWDPDGRVSHYEYLVTNNETGVFDPCDTAAVDPCGNNPPPIWHTVSGNDSVLGFTADTFADSLNANFHDNELDEFEFRRSHTFFIRAVDELGRRSEKPAHISFTARTLSPTIRIDIPRRVVGLTPSIVPPITTYQWTATDFVNTEAERQDPEMVRWILVSLSKFGDSWERTLDYIRKNPNAPEWSEWVDYKAPDGSGKRWTSPRQPFGKYYFAIQAKDEAGAVTPVFDEEWNARRILVSTQSTGPILTVYNKYIGTISTANEDTPVTIVDLPAGVPMSFEFSATADYYGGLVSGYRYGWDILDLSDDSQWPMDYTPFVTERATSDSKTHHFGSHTFYIEVIDNNGYKSRVGVTINIIPFGMERDLLFIDDVAEGPPSGWEETNGALPNDSEHDRFWMSMLADVANFDEDTDVDSLGVEGRYQVPLQKFADYKTVIWNSVGSHNSTSGSGLSPVIRWIDPNARTTSGRIQPNIVALFMAAGGRVLLAGDRIMTMSINRILEAAPFTPVFPIIFRYEIGGDQDGTYNDQQVGVRGVGDESFPYSDCCLNVLDIAYIGQPSLIRRPLSPPDPHSCPVNLIRRHGSLGAREDGLRACLPRDVTSGGGFPMLELRPEAAGPDKWWSEKGLNCDIYNPSYFHHRTNCGGVAEILPPYSDPDRNCLEPIYGLGCRDSNSAIFGATVAFWTKVYRDRVSDNGTVAARSAIWGFEPAYFEPASVKEALDIILFDEWALERDTR